MVPVLERVRVVGRGVGGFGLAGGLRLDVVVGGLVGLVGVEVVAVGEGEGVSGIVEGGPVGREGYWSSPPSSDMLWVER